MTVLQLRTVQPICVASLGYGWPSQVSSRRAHVLLHPPPSFPRGLTPPGSLRPFDWVGFHAWQMQSRAGLGEAGNGVGLLGDVGDAHGGMADGPEIPRLVWSSKV